MISAEWLGRISYSAALERQEAAVADLREGRAGEVFFLLEHEPVYTIGRTRDRSSLGDAATLPHDVVETNRGGQATYHGPGQLVGYPILDLDGRGRDLHVYLRTLEDFLVALCAGHAVKASRREGLTGTWVGERKIASIGVGVRRWITMHGFALNVTLASEAPFGSITPCGIQNVSMTSLEKESGREWEVRSVADTAARLFCDYFA